MGKGMDGGERSLTRMNSDAGNNSAEYMIFSFLFAMGGI
jgi:hypothetical protein